MQEKILLRRFFLAQRLGISGFELSKQSESLCSHLASWIKDKSFTSIFLFAPMKNEPNVFLLTKYLPKILPFALPRCLPKDKALEFYLWDKDPNSLIPGHYGVLEPTSWQRVWPDEQTLILVPTLALDYRGTRLGYGGGYYDRFLAQETKGTPAATLWQSFFGAKELPKEPFDQPLSWVVTENGVSRLKKNPV